MILHPFLNLLLDVPYPRIKFMDSRVDETDLTTYTFTACNVGEFGTAETSVLSKSFLADSRSRSRKLIVVGVHGLDALSTFNVSSVTIGGVSGTERRDRAGGTVGVNSAIYTWDSLALGGITNTDIVVTWSEAVTSCAIGVVSIDGLGCITFDSANQNQGTGALASNYTTPAENCDNYTVWLSVTTVASASAVLNLEEPITGGGGCIHQQLIYAFNGSAEISGAMVAGVAKQYIPSTAAAYSHRFDWSGTANSDYTSLAIS